MSKEEALMLYRSPLAFGVCANVKPQSNEASILLAMLEPAIDSCDMPGCGSPAVRVGVFAMNNEQDKPASEFRGLCERHRQFGMWSNAETAWGWD